MLQKMFNQHPTFYKWDKMNIGVIVGLIAPVIGMLLFLLSQFKSIDTSGYKVLLTNKQTLSPLLSLGCIANLVAFFIFIQKDYINAARGVILSTFIWAIPIIYTKFF